MCGTRGMGASARGVLFIIREGATWIRWEDIADPPRRYLKPALAVRKTSLLLHVMDVYLEGLHLSPSFGDNLRTYCMLYVPGLNVHT